MTTILLIGCSKTKAPYHRLHFKPAELYVSQLFKARMRHAQSRELEWMALSAKYGVWHADSRLRWYDQSFDDLCELDRAAWPLGVALHLTSFFDDDSIRPRDITFEIHAGRDYYDPLEQVLTLSGFRVVVPTRGLGIGQQLAYYKEQSDGLQRPDNDLPLWVSSQEAA